ncbi:glycosyltransferase, partial [Candidatus Poribacteria bacterium]|nr:glycosyltransferase [Candidatus Poribacteria bacterium]
RHRWNDNFADARNAALNASTGKWVFWLDADDRIEPRAVRTLRKFIERNTACGVFFPLESVIGSSGETVQNYSLRLFPNKPGISWKGAVHEQIADSLRSCGLELVNCPDLAIRHVGYEKEAEALKKNLRNLNLLAKELVANPEDPYVLFALAQAFLFFGQEQHAVKWLQTLWKLREKKDLSNNHVSPNPVDANSFAHEDSVGADSVDLNSVAHANSVGANSFAHAGRKEDENVARDIYWMAAIILSDCAARSDSADESETWLERAIELSPSNWVAHFLLGERKFLEGRMEEAAHLLAKASELGITPTLLPLDMNTIKEKLERYLAELKCAPACVRT